MDSKLKKVEESVLFRTSRKKDSPDHALILDQ